MLGGKINTVFTVLMYENGEATEDIVANDNSKIKLNIKAITKFPLNGQVDFEVNPSKEAAFALNFRVPEWSENFTAKVDDQKYYGKKGRLLSISRKWNAGGHISISFDMPLQVISGGVSYPNSVAFKRGPQILAIDQGINPGITTLKNVVYDRSSTGLTNAKATLPADWNWKEAYGMEMKVNDKPQKVILVPFSEAGQKSANIAVWINQ